MRTKQQKDQLAAKKGAAKIARKRHHKMWKHQQLQRNIIFRRAMKTPGGLNVTVKDGQLIGEAIKPDEMLRASTATEAGQVVTGEIPVTIDREVK